MAGGFPLWRNQIAGALDGRVTSFFNFDDWWLLGNDHTALVVAKIGFNSAGTSGKANVCAILNICIGCGIEILRGDFNCANGGVGASGNGATSISADEISRACDRRCRQTCPTCRWCDDGELHAGWHVFSHSQLTIGSGECLAFIGHFQVEAIPRNMPRWAGSAIFVNGDINLVFIAIQIFRNDNFNFAVAALINAIG